ncbi:MAG: hypothetical protein MnENMB40S_14640 [Rhizobiaceae bacterium MnEN-MB40S]|nr:MAG: hypothetical protein MnENMB40S_14640 [Rhizobiaceae bacterium MnEN-MB40S]
MAGELADNGGPVETIALKLDAANPALDAASTNNNGVVSLTDARGEDTYDAPEIANGSGNSSGRDLGAYELLNDESATTLVSDTQIQFADSADDIRPAA